MNRDHRVLFDSVAVATRPTPEQVVERLLTYAPTSSTEWTPSPVNWFVPNWYVDVSATIERKIAAFAHYETERRSSRTRGASVPSARPPRITGRPVVASTPSPSSSCAGSTRRDRPGAVAKLPQTLIVLALLVATAAAFAVTERLKLERSPITGTRVDRLFSPVCECARDAAVISFVLRQRSQVTVDVLDSDGDAVRILVRERDEARGRVSYTWDGRDEAGRIVPEGGIDRACESRSTGGRSSSRTRSGSTRRRRVSGSWTSFPACSRRTTTAATTGSPRRTRWTRSPGRCCSWTAAPPAWAIRSPQWASHWFGQVNGRPVRPGTYELRLRSFDRAGNRSRRTRAVPVHVRYVELARDRIEVVAGRRFGVRVQTDAASYRWLFAGERGVGREPLLVLTAPDAPGTYAVYVSVGRFADRAEVVVTEPDVQ